MASPAGLDGRHRRERCARRRTLRRAISIARSLRDAKRKDAARSLSHRRGRWSRRVLPRGRRARSPAAATAARVYLCAKQPPMLIPWGQNDQFFPSEGALPPRSAPSRAALPRRGALCDRDPLRGDRGADRRLPRQTRDRRRRRPDLIRLAVGASRPGHDEVRLSLRTGQSAGALPVHPRTVAA